MILTKNDRLILHSYIPVLEGLASYLGNSYEVVLHSLEDYEHSVISIWGGSHTGRTVGAPITDLALHMLEKITPESNSITYFSENKEGEPLKSTTIAIRGEAGQVIGLICINLYLNTSLFDILSALTPNHPSVLIQEHFSADADDLIRSTLQKVMTQVHSDQRISASNKNKAIVDDLNRQGIFRLKNAVLIAAQMLGVSKNTIYMHLRNLRADAAQ